MRQLSVLGLLGSLLFLVSCGDDSTPESQCPTSGGPGTLQLVVTGLPDPAAARVEVQAPSLTRVEEGPGESSWSQGSINIVPQIVATSHPLVRTAYKGTASSSQVSNGVSRSHSTTSAS